MTSEEPELSPLEAMGYLTGLRAVQTLRDYFPAWYATHLSARSCTPAHLLGAANALVMLVRSHYCEVWDPDWIHYGEPEDVLAAWADADRTTALNALDELSTYLAQPQPLLYGIGRASVLNAADPYHLSDFGPLTLALWHVAAHTEWGIGISYWPPSWSCAVEGEMVLGSTTLIRQLPQLPPTTVMPALCWAVGWTDTQVPLACGPWPRGPLLAYAFAETGNAAADTTNAEVQYEYGGEWAEGWESLPLWRDLTAAAAQIQRAYDAWEVQIARNPAEALPRVSQWLWSVAAHCQRTTVDPHVPDGIDQMGA